MVRKLVITGVLHKPLGGLFANLAAGSQSASRVVFVLHAKLMARFMHEPPPQDLRLIGYEVRYNNASFAAAEVGQQDPGRRASCRRTVMPRSLRGGFSSC